MEKPTILEEESLPRASAVDDDGVGVDDGHRGDDGVRGTGVRNGTSLNSQGGNTTSHSLSRGGEAVVQGESIGGQGEGDGVGVGGVSEESSVGLVEGGDGDGVDVVGVTSADISEAADEVDGQGGQSSGQLIREGGDDDGGDSGGSDSITIEQHSTGVQQVEIGSSGVSLAGDERGCSGPYTSRVGTANVGRGGHEGPHKDVSIHRGGKAHSRVGVG